MTRIHLLRRGDPLPDEADPTGGLSPLGREHLERCAGALARLGLWFDLIVSAPDGGSIQSAKIVAMALDTPQAAILRDPALRPAASATSLLDFLRACPSARSILLVGDAPLLPCLASLMLSGEARSTPILDIELDYGGLLCLEAQQPFHNKAKLLWHLPPLVLVRLAEKS